MAQVERHVAPADDALALGLDGVGEEALELGGARGVLAREEAHRDAVLPGRREVVADDGAEEPVGKLEQDPRAVARPRVGAGRAAVLEVLERRERAQRPPRGSFSPERRATIATPHDSCSNAGS